MPRDYTRKTDYTAEDLERGLLALALANGNATAASRSLKDQGCRIPKSTLQVWQRKHADRYSKIRDDVVPRVHARIAQEAEDVAREALEATGETMRLYRQCLELDENHKPVDLKTANALSSMARNTATVAGISTDKVRPLRDMPTATIEHRTPEHAMKRLQQLHPALFIDSSADEIPDAEIANGNGHHELPPAA